MTTDDATPLDPKEQMKAALAAKKAATHLQASGPDGRGAQGGGTQGPHTGKRQFRRKSGG